MRSRLLSDLIELGAGSIRRMDCIIAIELTTIPSQKLILERIQIAQKLYPETNKFPVFLNTYHSLEEFSLVPLQDKFQLELGIIHEKTLALKMSHYLGDALSMLLFLEVLLTGHGIEGEIAYRKLPPKKDSPYRNVLPTKGWMNHLAVTDKRQFITLTLTHPELPEGLVLNDILSLALLRSLPHRAKALWIPVNVRKIFWQGFGNGLSRMRLYPSRKKITLREELKHIRRQKIEAFHSGEVALPPLTLNLTPLNQKLLKLWLNRPWADWGTISLSHLEDRLNRFRGIKTLYGITNLHEKHHGGIFAFTKDNQTYVTLTFDETVARKDAQELLDKFQSEFQEILHELDS
ncbi:hypothetical protein [Peredibacter starrii]|uniref:Uncharacterized protein n=1 Tax=Peredibacter starrii TaxID=28202 RepID=A0AAX4HU81_9BACT|nr:hypothetical protein [Peredibacter starrii]WPU66943.1 hypothetical protein SOO65_09290 [Peredibacter starrii]